MSADTLNRTRYSLRLKMGVRANLDLVATAVRGIQGEPSYTTNTKHFFIHDGTKYEPVQTLDMAVMFEDEIVSVDDEIVYDY